MIHPRFSLGLILLLAPAVAFTSDLAPAMDDLRIGVSQASFGKVNPNDATAAGAGQKSSLSSQRQGVVAGGVEIEPVFPEL